LATIETQVVKRNVPESAPLSAIPRSAACDRLDLPQALSKKPAISRDLARQRDANPKAAGAVAKLGRPQPRPIKGIFVAIKVMN
jgi:hypothetical protein